MNKRTVESSIKEYFAKMVEKDPKILNAYLLVHSDKLDINMNLAEGLTDNMTGTEKMV